MDFKSRKPTRLKNYNYSSPGAYFITICTQDRKQLLSRICVGDGVLDVPENRLTCYGKIAEKHIIEMSNFYDHVSVDKYVIMPNHIHLLIQIKSNPVSGSSRTPNPTNQKLHVSFLLSKDFATKNMAKISGKDYQTTT